VCNIVKIINLIDGINKLSKYFVVIFTCSMVISLSLQIISRFIPWYSPSWSGELARFSMIYAVFIASSLALRKQELLAVEVIKDNIPERVQNLLIIIINLISLLFFIILIVKGIDLILKVKTQLAPSLQVSMSIPYASIPVGGFLLAINSLAVIIEKILNINNDVSIR